MGATGLPSRNRCPRAGPRANAVWMQRQSKATAYAMSLGLAPVPRSGTSSSDRTWHRRGEGDACGPTLTSSGIPPPEQPTEGLPSPPRTPACTLKGAGGISRRPVFS